MKKRKIFKPFSNIYFKKFENLMDPNELAKELKEISDKLDIWVENTLTAIQTKVENQECMLKNLEGIFQHSFIIKTDKVSELKSNREKLASKESRIKETDSETAQKVAQVRAEIESLRV